MRKNIDHKDMQIVEVNGSHLFYNYHIRNRSFSLVIELSVVRRVIDNSCFPGPKSRRAAAIKIYRVGHSQQMADICSLIYACSICPPTKTSINCHQVGITFIVPSKSGTRMPPCRRIGKTSNQYHLLCQFYRPSTKGQQSPRQESALDLKP